MAMLEEMVEGSLAADGPRVVAALSVRMGGVDPLGLRQINFGLMDRVFPSINNVARHARPYVLMAWAWRRVRHILERGKHTGATDQAMRDFVDRIEALYAWSQFLNDRNTDLPGGQAMRELLDADGYEFGGPDWLIRRDVRRYSTGLISPLNYGPTLQTMGWLARADQGVGVFRTPTTLDPLLDEFEALMADELEHPVFCSFDPVMVARSDAQRWGKLWELSEPLESERVGMLARLGGDLAPKERRAGVELVRAAIADRGNEQAELGAVRARMADLPEVWAAGEAPAAAAEWRTVQVRQAFRLALEALFYWTVDTLTDRPLHSGPLADRFLEDLGPANLPETSGEWLLREVERDNPTVHLNRLQTALRAKSGVADAIISALRHSLREAPDKAAEFEAPDRLPLAWAARDARGWASLTPREFLIRVLENWIMAQHTYWSVGRGLADARSRGKTILRLRIVMDEGGWTQTPGAVLGSAPEATPDRLETVVSLLKECGGL